MTGYWIKLRKGLRTDPRVLALASKLGISKAEVIGALAILWFMADDHGERYAVGVTRVTLSCEIGVTEFAENLPECWLAEDENGLYLPNYTEHNGSTAKARGLSAERMQRKRYAEGVTKASPEEKRREDTTTTTLPEKSGETVKPKRNEYPQDFETFWGFVPSEKKSGKGAAYRVWQKMSAEDRLKAIDRMEWTAGCFDALDPGRQRIQYLTDPQGWLSQRKFEDADEAVKLIARGK